ncbi:hypothetical protein ACVJBD_000196 [Rhizobium mongolense]
MRYLHARAVGMPLVYPRPLQFVSLTVPPELHL